MLRAKNIWVMGGDPRQAALATLLADDGHSVHTYALEQGAGMKCEPSTAGADRADCVILPLPAAGPDGGLNTPLSERRHHLEEVLDGLRPGQLVCAGMVDGRLKELADANQALMDKIQAQTKDLLGSVLDQRTVAMKNAFNMNDH